MSVPTDVFEQSHYGLEEDERLNRKAYFGRIEGDPPLNEYFKTSKDENTVYLTYQGT